MSGFLHRLVARTIGQANVVRPRPVLRFAATLDLPVDSSADSTHVGSARVDSADAYSSHAALDTGGSAVERVDGTAIPRRRTQAEREESAGNVLPAIQGLPSQVGLEQPAAAASLEKRDTGDIPAREEIRASREGIPAHDDALTSEGSAQVPRTVPVVSTRAESARGLPEAQRVAARDHGADSATPDPVAAGAIERHARTDEPRVVDAERTRRQRVFDAGDTFDVALPSETIQAPPLALTLAGPRTGARESEAIGLRTAADRARFDAAPEPETTIVNVTIGRIEVRSPAEPAVRTFRREAPAAPEPRDQLDAYLRARSGSKP